MQSIHSSFWGIHLPNKAIHSLHIHLHVFPCLFSLSLGMQVRRLDIIYIWSIPTFFSSSAKPTVHPSSQRKFSDSFAAHNTKFTIALHSYTSLTKMPYFHSISFLFITNTLYIALKGSLKPLESSTTVFPFSS